MDRKSKVSDKIRTTLGKINTSILLTEVTERNN